MKAVVHTGNVLDILPTLPAESVSCVVTSPPYWGLRDYGVDGQLGLEATPDEYVANMVAVFREVRRVLRKDGTLWLNLGDSYAADRGGTYMPAETLAGGVSGQGGEATMRGRGDKVDGNARRDCKRHGLKHKDLVGIPWRVAFALQQPYEKPHTIAAATDRAWMAALIDGEGCIGIRRYDSHSNGLDHQRCQDSFVPYLSIGNNDRELLDRCVQVTGYGKVGVKDRPDVDSRGIKSRHTYYGWRLDGNAAVDVIRDVYPFLVAKRRQAILCHTLDLSNKNGKALRGNSALPADEQARREEMKRLVNACNQRESVDIPAWAQEPEREIEPGWYLRSEIIWAKPNPMPESVTDRPTKSHETLFLMSKAARYWYDAEAVAEHTDGRERFGNSRILTHDDRKDCSRRDMTQNWSRNRRTVWHIATQPYPEAHFATYPEKLVEPCVLAGCPAQVCAECGAPWERLTEREHFRESERGERPSDYRALGQPQQAGVSCRVTTLGWQPTCTCNADTVPGTVLDPFTGSGTTGAVACRLGRNFVGVELNPEYAAMAERRIAPYAAQEQLPV